MSRQRLGAKAVSRLTMCAMVTRAMTVDASMVEDAGAFVVCIPALALLFGEGILLAVRRSRRQVAQLRTRDATHTAHLKEGYGMSGISAFFLCLFFLLTAAQLLTRLASFIHSYSFSAVDGTTLLAAAAIAMTAVAFTRFLGMESVLHMGLWPMLGIVGLALIAAWSTYEPLRLLPMLPTQPWRAVWAVASYLTCVWPVLLPYVFTTETAGGQPLLRACRRGLLFGTIWATLLLLAAVLCRSPFAQQAQISPVMALFAGGHLGRYLYRLDPLMSISLSIGAVVSGAFCLFAGASLCCRLLKIPHLRPAIAFVGGVTATLAAVLWRPGASGVLVAGAAAIPLLFLLLAMAHAAVARPRKAYRCLALFMAILLPFAMMGCHDTAELDDAAHVLSIAVDRGETKAYRFTLQMPYLISQGGQYGVPLFRSLTVEGDTLLEAAENANVADARTMSFTHLNFFVVSEELARGPQLRELVTAAVSQGTLRTGAMLVVAEESAQSFVRGLENEEYSNLERLQENLIRESSKTGLFPATTLQNYYDAVTDPTEGDTLCALGRAMPEVEIEDENAEDSVRRGGLGSELSGSVLLQEGVAVQTLTAEETRAILMLRGEFSNGYMVYEHQTGEVLTLALQAPRAPQIDVQADPPSAQITVYLRASVAERTGYSSSAEELKEGIEEWLYQTLSKAAEKAAASGTEPFLLIRHAAAGYFTLGAFLESGLREKLQSIVPKIVIKLQLADDAER